MSTAAEKLASRLGRAVEEALKEPATEVNCLWPDLATRAFFIELAEEILAGIAKRQRCRT